MTLCNRTDLTYLKFIILGPWLFIGYLSVISINFHNWSPKKLLAVSWQHNYWLLQIFIAADAVQSILDLPNGAPFCSFFLSNYLHRHLWSPPVHQTKIQVLRPNCPPNCLVTWKFRFFKVIPKFLLFYCEGRLNMWKCYVLV